MKTTLSYHAVSPFAPSQICLSLRKEISGYIWTTLTNFSNWIIIIKKKGSFSVTDIFQENQTSVWVSVFGRCKVALPQPFPTIINLCPHLPYGGHWLKTLYLLCRDLELLISCSHQVLIIHRNWIFFPGESEQKCFMRLQRRDSCLKWWPKVHCVTMRKVQSLITKFHFLCCSQFLSGSVRHTICNYLLLTSCRALFAW